jgi:hypothetical protein
MKRLLQAIILGTVFMGSLAYAQCTTQSFYDTRTGRMTVCTTCYDANGNPISTICS